MNSNKESSIPQTAEPSSGELKELCVINDQHRISIVSNPIRYAALEELFQRKEPRTATEIAQAVHVSPSIMSYHLRELAKAGIIRRGATIRDRREAPWVLTARKYKIVVSKQRNPEVRRKLIETLLARLRQRIDDVLTGKLSKTYAKRRSLKEYTLFSTGNLTLTKEEAVQAQLEVHKVWEKYERISSNRKPSQYPVNEVYVWSCLPE